MVTTIPRPPELPSPSSLPDPRELQEAADPEAVSPQGGGSGGLAAPEPDARMLPEVLTPADPRAEMLVNPAPGSLPPTYPVVINGSVEALIEYFAARERDRFGTWIARSGRYLGMIRQVFRDHGLPEELAYTAMIESGFSPRAVSRVGAKGMWQFMEATARRYGLTVTRWVDERLDPVKSTVAAARYLSDLYGMFGHWFLAQAAYNAGEARVGRAIQRARTSDFWALTQTRFLPDETKLFVPQILAAAVITREPARYGFAVTPEQPLAFDEVTVRRPLDLDTIAELAEVTVEQIRELNPALLARITPPFGAYTLRLPVGAGVRFEEALRDTPPSRVPVWGIHRVGRSQSLAEIARLYRVTPQKLIDVNHLSGARLRGVTELLVPVGTRVAAGLADRVTMSRPPPPPALAAGREVVVQRGDTLAGLAARHGLKPQTLARLNGLDVDGILPVGARLKIRTP